MRKLKKIFGINPEYRTDAPAGLRGTGVEGGDGIYNEYFNQILFEVNADHIVDTETNVKLANNPTGTCYYNSTSTEFQDRNDATVTFSDGDRIAWRGLDVIAASIDLSAYDDIEHIMFQGVTIDLQTYDLALGENQRGELDLTGSGSTLTVLSSDGLRVKHSGLTVVNNSGDIVINNIGDANNYAIEWEAVNLSVSIQTVSAIDADADKIQLVDTDNVIKIVEPFDLTFTMPADLNGGTEKSSTWYEAYAGYNSTGSVERKLVPILTGTTSSTSSGNLVDAGATFLTDLVTDGSIVLNNTDGTKTTVSADASAETTISLTDDIFTASESYTIYIVPTFSSGFNFRASVVEVYNGSGNDFERIKYKQPTKIPEYGEKTCSAWINFNGSGTVSIRDSFNVLSVTDNGIGDYTVNFINDMQNANYSVSVGYLPDNIGAVTPRMLFIRNLTVSGFNVYCVSQDSGARTDYSIIMCQVFQGP